MTLPRFCCLTALCTAACLSGCDRAQISEAIFVAGITAATSPTGEAGGWSQLFPAVSPEGAEQGAVGGLLADRQANGAGHDSAAADFHRAVARLVEMGRQGIPVEAVPADAASAPSVSTLVNRVNQFVAQHVERSDELSDEEHEMLELQLLAVGAAARVDVAAYQAQRDELAQSLFGQPYDAAVLERGFVHRLVTKRLGGQAVDEQAQQAVRRHVELFPENSMNVALYTTLADRLVAQDDPAGAIRVCREGARLCSAAGDVGRLTEKQQRLCAEHPHVVGAPMRFNGPTLQGEMFDLAEWRGRVVLVRFAASWCPVCVQEEPEIVRLYAAFHDQGLEVIAVSLDRERRALAEYVGKHNIPWPQLFSDDERVLRNGNPIAQYYRVTTIPRNFLVDREGHIAATGLRGEAALAPAITALLRAGGDGT